MKPKFYSKEAVAVLTILSPILGTILFSYNLKEIGKGRFSPYFVIGGILWILLTKKLLAGIVADSLSQLLFSGLWDAWQ
jgi:Na+/H+ antiporter NhaA